jgi:hypothetical protein
MLLAETHVGKAGGGGRAYGYDVGYALLDRTLQDRGQVALEAFVVEMGMGIDEWERHFSE